MKKIGELFAFVMVDGGGDEGIPAFTHEQYFVPMVGADMARVESFRVMAQALCNASGKPMKILRFSQAEQIGEVNPQ